MQKQYKKYFCSLLCAFLALMSYTWFFPQTAFYDCVRVVEGTDTIKEASVEDVNTVSNCLSLEDQIRLFRIEKSPFRVQWFFLK